MTRKPRGLQKDLETIEDIYDELILEVEDGKDIDDSLAGALGFTEGDWALFLAYCEWRSCPTHRKLIKMFGACC